MKEKINKSTEIFDLLKIPDKELLKQSQIEVGKLKSHIEELEFEISRIKDSFTCKGNFVSDNEIKMYNSDMNIIKEKLYYKKLHGKILEERLKNKQLTEKYNSLIYQLSNQSVKR